MRFLLVSLVLFSCGTVGYTSKNHPEAFVTLGESCDPSEDLVVCPKEKFMQGLNECAELYRDVSLCDIDLDTCKKTNSIDIGVCNSQLDNCQTYRWVWGVVGFALGSAVAVGLSVGLQ